MIRATLSTLYGILSTGSMKYLCLGLLMSLLLFLGSSIATAYGFQSSDPFLLRLSVMLLFTMFVAFVFVFVVAMPTAYRLAKLDRKLGTTTSTKL